MDDAAHVCHQLHHHHAHVTDKNAATRQLRTRNSGWNSSSNFPPQMLSPPFPVPEPHMDTTHTGTQQHEIQYNTTVGGEATRTHQ